MQDRGKLIDEAFDNLIVENKPEPIPNIMSQHEVKVADDLKAGYLQPVTYLEGYSQFITTNKDIVEAPNNTKQEFGFSLSDGQVLPPANKSSDIESINSQPINVDMGMTDWKSKEQIMNPPLNQQTNIQSNKDLDDDSDGFGEFQGSDPTPAVEAKVEETPAIYQLSSDDIAAQESIRKKEPEVEEIIYIDEDKDQEYTEVKQTYEFGATNKEALSEPIKDEAVPKEKESKFQENWANFINIDFDDSVGANDKEISKKEEGDNKEMDEENLLENFLSAITEKMTENSKASPPKETPKVIAEVNPVPPPAPAPSRNIFYLSDKTKPVIEEDEKDLNTNTEKLKEIEEWLWFNEEIDSYNKVHEHLIHLQQMNEYNEKKKQATEQDELEKAIEYKNKANKAKEKLLSDMTIKYFLRSLDKNETMGELIDKVISLNDIPLVP